MRRFLHSNLPKQHDLPATTLLQTGLLPCWTSFPSPAHFGEGGARSRAPALAPYLHRSPKELVAEAGTAVPRAGTGGERAGADPLVTASHRPGQHPLPGLRSGGGGGGEVKQHFPREGRAQRQRLREREAPLATVPFSSGWSASRSRDPREKEARRSRGREKPRRLWRPPSPRPGRCCLPSANQGQPARLYTEPKRDARLAPAAPRRGHCATLHCIACSLDAAAAAAAAAGPAASKTPPSFPPSFALAPANRQRPPSGLPEFPASAVAVALKGSCAPRAPSRQEASEASVGARILEGGGWDGKSGPEKRRRGPAGGGGLETARARRRLRDKECVAFSRFAMLS
ncbi:Hypothetical predicted protein [Podarcis lilfordi]|uniref:Uncharacterized protein n=1 Tax=Podarcis lilfordi TaxID=74358 RepID=A0AA35NTF3_9SAUR|nr:Hypothetical predicted protein [Podarcis lilfordi]